MNPKTKYAVLFFILCVVLPAFAHQGHKKKPQSQTNVLPPSSAQTMQSQPAATHVEEHEMASGETSENRDPKTIMKEAMWSHFHNKLVHFPFALGVIASILIFFTRKKPELLVAIRILLIVAGLFAVAAYFTGKAQEEPFEQGEMHEFLEFHQWFGIASGICLWAGVLISSKAKNLLTLYSVVQLILLSVTGFLGGILAHG
ncbi:hypothetical protein L0244_36555 [bacterium]|nr:hypothetical protein [bacterium]